MKGSRGLLRAVPVLGACIAAAAQDNPTPGFGTAGGSNARTYVYQAPYVFGDGSWTNMIGWKKDVEATYGAGRNAWANVTFDAAGDLYYVGYTGPANGGKLIKASGASGAFIWASELQVQPGGDSITAIVGSVLQNGKRLVYTPAVSNCMAAHDQATGALVWQTAALPARVTLTPALRDGVLYGITNRVGDPANANYAFAVDSGSGNLLFAPVAISTHSDVGAMDVTFVPNVFGTGEHLVCWQGSGDPPDARVYGVRISATGASRVWTYSPVKVGVSRIAYSATPGVLYAMHYGDSDDAVEALRANDGACLWRARSNEMNPEYPTTDTFSGGYYGTHTLRPDGSGIIFAGKDGDIWSIADGGDLGGDWLPAAQRTPPVGWYYNGADTYGQSQTMAATIAGTGGPVFISGTAGSAATSRRIYAQDVTTGLRLWEWLPPIDPTPTGGAYCFRVLSIGPDGAIYFILREEGAEGTLYKLLPSGTLQHSACCLPGGFCLEVSELECVQNQGGVWYGLGLDCGPSGPCPGPAAGACCISGTCTVGTESWCTSQGGDYQGDGWACNPDPCPPAVGGCCVGTECVPEVTAAACAAQSGTYLGDGVVCGWMHCPRACCYPGGVCEEREVQSCLDGGGTSQAYGTSCTPDPCAQQTGGCCIGTSCTEGTAADCLSRGGAYEGDGTGCAPNPCPTLHFWYDSVGDQGGTGWSGGWWMQYPSGWATQWWLSEYDLARQKRLELKFWVDFAGAAPAVAVNYTVGTYTDPQFPPFDDPPIVRVPVTVTTAGYYEFTTLIPFCPRWVSVDVMKIENGDFTIQGTIDHICLTGPTTGACCVGIVCTDNASAAECATMVGSYKGDGSVCDPVPATCYGDADCSTAIDFDDINYFVAALAGGEAGWENFYKSKHGGALPPCTIWNCDADGSGRCADPQAAEVDFDDISPFVAKLVAPPACP